MNRLHAQSTPVASTVSPAPGSRRDPSGLQQAAGNAFVQERMAGQTSTGAVVGEGGSLAPQAAVQASVRMPSPPSQDGVRDLILTGPEFGYQPEDLARFHKALQANPQLFVLVDSRSKDPLAPATPEQMESWCDKQTRLARITISGDRVSALRGIKAQRVLAMIEGVLMAMAPADRERLTPVLTALLGAAGASRNVAANDLANEIRGGGAKLLAPVLDRIAAGMPNDPLVTALRAFNEARSAEAPKDFVGPVTREGVLDTALADQGAADAGRAKGLLQQQRKDGTLDRSEAAAIYGLTAATYAAAGNAEASERDQMTSRFFTVDDKERATAKRQGQGAEITVDPPGRDSLQAESETTRGLIEVREEREAYLRQFEEMSSASEVPETGTSEEGKLGAIVAGPALFNTFWKWRAAAVRCQIILDLRAREEKLTRKSWQEHHYPVPPQPAELERLAVHFERIAAARGPQAAKAAAYAAEAREFIETSRAFWALP